MPIDNLSIMAIFKNETMNLQVWVEHYIWQGVDHFYMIDNGSTDQPLDILQYYIDLGIITYYYRSEKYLQPQHYRYVFDNENLKEKTEWLCICDLDEFFFGLEKKLSSTLDDFNNYDVIYKNSHFYGSDNLIEHPKDIRTAIIHRQEDIQHGTKYIFKPKIINDSSEIWIHWLVDSGTTYKKYLTTEIFDNSKIRLNHYNIQSLEYFQKIKMMRGDVSHIDGENSRTMEVFHSLNKLSIIKDDVLKCLIENNCYNKNGEPMKFYDENNIIINNNSIEKIEQDLASIYILEDDIVLELGARYGSVSCAINRNLKNKLNQISVEPDETIWNALKMNKIRNNCNFNIINGFIGLKNMSLELEGYAKTFIYVETSNIPSYSMEEIKAKYNINKFNVLVADCEGYLEVLFDENPNLYNDLRLIIFEEDCIEKCNYDKIKQHLINNNFCKIIEGHQNVWIKPTYYQLNENFIIKYGDNNTRVDITDIVYNKCKYDNLINIIKEDENRAKIFNDPLVGIIKSIFIYNITDSEINIIEIQHYQSACINVDTNQLYIDNIPDLYTNQINNFNENIIINYSLDNNNKIEPNYTIIDINDINYIDDINNIDCYKFNNVTIYSYTFGLPELKITKNKDNSFKNNYEIYLILDCPGYDALAHWVYESFIYFNILEKLNKLYADVKIVTSNKKRYVKNFLKFWGFKNELIYEIKNNNNICFFPPISTINCDTPSNFNKLVLNFINKIELLTIDFNQEYNILFLPRNSVDNYFPDDRIHISLLYERRDNNSINYITNGVINDNGIVINTYELNNFQVQFSIIRNSKNIIVDYGSSYQVNCIFCKNKNIIILNPRNEYHYLEQKALIQIHNILTANNNVIMLTNYNSYEDIKKHFI